MKNVLLFRKVFPIFYFVLFLIYLFIGLQPAEAVTYKDAVFLDIPRINLSTIVTESELSNGRLSVPDTIAGSFSRAQNKTLLVGHSSTVFHNLNEVLIGDSLKYNNKTFIITSKEILLKNNINMNSLLKAEKQETLLIMTCAGKNLENHDATHRLIITAVIE